MLAMELVESAQQQARKSFVDEGKSAAVCLRLTEPWHHSPHQLFADAWFGGMLTAFSLLKRGFFSISNVKIQTKHFCMKELWADAGGKPWARDVRAYRQVTLREAGKEATFTGAFHMNKQHMTLLGTAGSPDEAPLITRRRVYMNEFDDMVRWEGELRQPMIHAEDRTYLNAVDVHNNLALGLHSVCTIGANPLQLKIFLALLAMAEANAYLTYVDIKKLTSAKYSHFDFKTDLESGLLECAAAMRAGARERLVDARRATRGPEAQVATGDSVQPRTQMPPGLQGHRLQYDAQKNRKYMSCGTITKSLCGRALCGVS
jgi:hypothetical protein